MVRLAVVCALLFVALAGSVVTAQRPTTAISVATDPDVLGAERLFSAWLEGQIAYKGLPGVAVGVVSDQQLVWAKGFGFANVQERRPMTPATLFRMASHSKLFTATAIKAAVAWDASWARFAGLYRGAWGDEQVVLLKDRLVLITPNGSNLDDPVTLEALGDGRFRFVAKTGGGEVGEIVRFEEENGRVTRLVIGDGFFTRVQN